MYFLIDNFIKYERAFKEFIFAIKLYIEHDLIQIF